MHNNVSKFEESKRDISSIKQSVFKIVILTIITFYFYPPIWILKVRHTINNLNSNKKISSIIPIMFLVLAAIYLIAAFFEGGIEGISPSSAYVGYLSTLSNYLFYLLIIGNIVLLLQCFKIRRILLDHYGANLNISAWATFFLEIFYLQHKINRL